MEVKFRDLRLISYDRAYEIQEQIFNKIIFHKTGKPIIENEVLNHLLFCEHPHVYTLGKSGSENNLLIDYIQLQAKNAVFHRTNRGGDITYHGPGQIVGYPILDLEQFNMGVKTYVHAIEESIILTLSEYNIAAGRLEGATGVWLEAHSSHARKICAIGIRTSRYVSMHGFAFNVNTDLTYFNYINPCGFTDKAVTSLQKELNKFCDVEDVKLKLKENISKVFGMKLIPDTKK
ncbi:MAG: lipoyl(octanoyl) transferase LipB [Bacteroidales bacterium]|nr:lipoyl(octanoyl) transferase LipB [Bacteroidales bacterium]MDD4213868.1 lipoyl(octanoyl) transferase LipB [Bacteroidales bacterium]